MKSFSTARIQSLFCSWHRTAEFFLILCAMLLTVIILNSSAYAQQGVFAPDSCDPSYFESLEARAWLEAQREITQNQNLIFKPDSVLEYTCFDSHLNQVAASAQDLFSETNRWGGPPTNIVPDLENILDSYQNYDKSNFNHSFLGGRMNMQGAQPGPNIEPNTTITPGEYNCDVMNTVWEQAKCMDFIHVADKDGFYRFSDQNSALDYIDADDKRSIPTQCQKLVDYEANLMMATSDPQQTPWIEDPIDTYFQLFNPQGGGCGNDLSMLITGLRVYPGDQSVNNGNDYQETICLVPGCYYNPQSRDCETF